MLGHTASFFFISTCTSFLSVHVRDIRVKVLDKKSWNTVRFVFVDDALQKSTVSVPSLLWDPGKFNKQMCTFLSSFVSSGGEAKRCSCRSIFIRGNCPITPSGIDASGGQHCCVSSVDSWLTHAFIFQFHGTTFHLVLTSRAFRISAPKIWNSLPSHILRFQALSSLRRHFKTHYFQSAYPAP